MQMQTQKAKALLDSTATRAERASDIAQAVAGVVVAVAGVT